MKKADIISAFKGETVDRVPVGFWFHYAEDEFQDVYENPTIRKRNIEGHKKFVEEVHPDFIKVMSDGYFRYPNPLLKSAKSIYELKDIEPLGENHPWIQDQVTLIQEIVGNYPNEIASFYNMFSPATLFKFTIFDGDFDVINNKLADFILEDEEMTKNMLLVLAEDLAVLSKRVIAEGGVDGIYLSTQNIQDDRITQELQMRVVKPSDFVVLDAAAAEGGLNILHICGYEGATNYLENYRDYPAPVFNYAQAIESLPISEAKKFFGDKVIMGGFDNRTTGILYQGSKEEIADYTNKLIEKVGSERFIIGADCTIPRDIDIKNIVWVREAANEFSK
ncbi:uroporphyrinogen decarboxylase family protein [uncultured Trichococcus sp.]|uniref:uroporphyrinogen decarboxylase family protein n=1 Tax=uncultured Trichococcus sp. TaxID=189665 RepID=UPI0029C8C691|nr:uroporphyrinogen decarboxylase family protein [uncultured Trichococcus sp.]